MLKIIIFICTFFYILNTAAFNLNNSHGSECDHQIILNRTIKQSNLNINLKQNILIISSKTQKLYLYDANSVLLKTYIISTSKKGLGQLIGSFKTPIGLHRITEKIGHNVPNYGIFHKRAFTNNIWKKPIFKNAHRKDFIVTRILRLEGLEPGVNLGKNYRGQIVDSFHRGIYIHGTTMDWKLGTPATKGCVHLTSKDIVELFNLVSVGSIVIIL